jgi:hypothetical protein
MVSVGLVIKRLVLTGISNAQYWRHGGVRGNIALTVCATYGDVKHGCCDIVIESLELQVLLHACYLGIAKICAVSVGTESNQPMVWRLT